MVSVLAALPIAATLCQTVCGASQGPTTSSGADRVAESRHRHHGGVTHGDLAVAVGASQRVASSAAVHDCTAPSDTLPQGEAAATLGRGDTIVVVLSPSPAMLSASSKRQMAPLVLGDQGLGDQGLWRSASRPDCAPLVLRV